MVINRRAVRLPGVGSSGRPRRPRHGCGDGVAFTAGPEGTVAALDTVVGLLAGTGLLPGRVGVVLDVAAAVAVAEHQRDHVQEQEADERHRLAVREPADQ